MELDSDGGLEFGFVPRKIVTDLQDIGNWKLRADAIETLQTVVGDLGKSDVYKVEPHLPALVRFINKLLVDPNFKISLTAIQIFGSFIDKVGDKIKPLVANVMPSLVDKLGDSKSAVRTSDVKVLNKLTAIVGPSPVIEGLIAGMKKDNAQTREEVLNMFIQTLLKLKSGAKNEFEAAALVPVLARALRDREARVRQVAIEALAVTHSIIGANRVNSLLDREDVASDARRQLADRFTVRALPHVAFDGSVE
eukprot:CAMPEP_0118947672 /NCGR_PEP_ID=MMETSP1169-20130426/46465_1 /TAXON_ID=36882 /ORGANISM="Pyramimonas obovata, Strain CCMP722" /LENGTH=250 /DNA_ID=CAMNT_0006893931 /DNA_START=202 /DNA_END=951 /DNA_ORIENTATION=-